MTNSRRTDGTFEGVIVLAQIYPYDPHDDDAKVDPYPCIDSNACVLTQAQPGFVAYVRVRCFECTINVTTFPANSGDHLIGTYSGTSFKADGGDVDHPSRNGKFDGIRP